MRERNVVVAIVRDGAFPMTVLDDGTNLTGERAHADLVSLSKAPFMDC